MKENRKGFTLPELLASIVILGILMSVAIVSVQSVLNKSHKTYDEEQLDMFTTAAQSYFTDNKSKLPVNLLGTNSVTLGTLKETSYIDNVVDSKNVSCDVTKSKVTVTRYDTGKYAYSGILYCGRNVIGGQTTNESSTMTVKFSEYEGANNIEQVYNSNDNIYYTNNKVTTSINLTGNKGMASYKYVVYKNDKKFKEGEAKALNDVGNEFNDKITISKDTYGDGKYKIEVIAYDKAGKYLGSKSSTIWLDTVAPTCEINFYGTPGENGWYKETHVTVSYTPNNDIGKTPTPLNGSAITKSATPLYNDTSNKRQGNTTRDGQDWYCYVRDKAGNEYKTSKNILVDMHAPDCTSSVNKLEANTYNYKQYGTWYNGNVEVSQKCNDEGKGYSGCVKEVINYKDLSTTSGNEWSVKFNETIAKDVAGNETTCKAISAGVDKKAPSCNVTVDGNPGSQNWFKNGKNVTISFSITGENGSGKGKYGLAKTPKTVNSKTSDTQGNTGSEVTWYGYVSDNVGNECTDQTFPFRVDLNPPTCSKSIDHLESGSYIRSGPWYNKNVKISQKCSDTGPSGCIENVVNTTDIKANSGQVSIGNLASVTTYDKAGNTTTCPAVDAGVDKAGPSCEIRADKQNYTWYGKSYLKTKYEIVINDNNASGAKSYDWYTNYTNAKIFNKQYNLYSSNNSNGTTKETNKSSEVIGGELMNTYVKAVPYDNVGNKGNECINGPFMIDDGDPYIDVGSGSNVSGEGFVQGGAGGHNTGVRIVTCTDDLTGPSELSVDLDKNGNFLKWEGTSNGKILDYSVNGNVHTLKHTWATNGLKETRYYCTDNANNNSGVTYAGGAANIYCRCRAAENLKYKEGSGSNAKEVVAFKQGEVVYDYNDKWYKEVDGKKEYHYFTCENEHKAVWTPGKYKGKLAIGVNDLYLSCASQ